MSNEKTNNSQVPTPQYMDPLQVQKMTEALRVDLKALKSELDKERAEKKKIEETMKSQSDVWSKNHAELEELRKHMDAVKNEKRQFFTKELDTKVLPYLKDLRAAGEKDSQFTNSLDQFQDKLNNNVQTNALMDNDAMAQFQVIRAAASANQVTTSKLNELFKDQQKHKEEYEALNAEKDKMETEMKEAIAKEKEMIEALKKELSEVKGKYEKADNNIKNTDTHFEKTENENDSTNTQQQDQEKNPNVVQAAASNSNNYNSGFETLFNFEPMVDWRTRDQSRFG